MKARQTAFAVLLAQALLPPALLSGAAPPSLGRERPDVIANWQSRISAANEAAQTGEWKKAKKIADTLLPEMCDRIESGEGANRLLAAAALLRAVGEAGMGNLRDARWDFGMAQALYPPSSEVDLTAYGAPGKLLEGWRYGPRPLEEAQEPDAETEKIEESGSSADVTPPRKIRGEAPKYPYAKRQACLDGPIVVEFVIDEEGHVADPRLLTLQDPVLGLAAMDPLRTWLYEPGRLEGKPIKIYFTLTVNFEVQSCSHPVALQRKAKEKEEREP